MTQLQKKVVSDNICFLLALRTRNGIEYAMLVELIFRDARYDFPKLGRQDVIDQIKWLKGRRIILGKLKKNEHIRLNKRFIGKEIDWDATLS